MIENVRSPLQQSIDRYRASLIRLSSGIGRLVDLINFDAGPFPTLADGVGNLLFDQGPSRSRHGHRFRTMAAQRGEVTAPVKLII